jgi:hypothetical protein
MIVKTGTLTTADLVITETTAGGSGHVDLRLTSFNTTTQILTDVAPATSMTSTNAYFLNWGPQLVQA